MDPFLPFPNFKPTQDERTDRAKSRVDVDGKSCSASFALLRMAHDARKRTDVDETSRGEPTKPEPRRPHRSAPCSRRSPPRDRPRQPCHECQRSGFRQNIMTPWDEPRDRRCPHRKDKPRKPIQGRRTSFACVSVALDGACVLPIRIARTSNEST